MRCHTLLAALAAASLRETAAKPLGRSDDGLAAQIETENKIALQGVLNNLGPDGSQAPGASAGVFIASPSTDNPNCKKLQI